MKTIVAGSRSINDYQLINQHLSKISDEISEIISGGARGVDRLGELWAKNNNKECIIFPADWTKHGKSAGFIRNDEMAKYADCAIIFWDGQSPGSKNMYDTMKKYNKPITLITTDNIKDIKIKYKEFDCGCKFPINENGGLDIEFKVENINFQCPKTWELISSGNTLGIFQLESYFGQGLAKDLQPDNMEHLSALAAIIRPGAKESIRDGKSITQHYIDRRHGREQILASHKPLETILNKTLCEMIYQEDALNIAKEIAGFSLIEADSLRKAIGKKLPEKMKELEEIFLQGCKKVGKIDEEEAKEIFESIRKSQRYSFNKCLHPKTTVETYGGCLKSLDIIKVGDYIKCPSKDWDTYGSVSYKRVLNIYYNNIELYNVILENNLHIKCSLYHKFMNIYGQHKSLASFMKNKDELMTELGPSYIESISKDNKQSAIDIEIQEDEGQYSHMFFANNIITSNSHSISYAHNSYMTAYAKAHFPLIFFKNYLRHATNKPNTFEEMKRLVFDAKKYNIEVQPPQLSNKNKEFEILNGNIYYGLTNIRGIGESAYKSIIDLYEIYNNLPWVEFLFKIALNINKTCIKSLIGAGALNMQMSRSKMLYEHSIAMKFTKKEKDWIINNINLSKTSLKNIINNILEYPVGRSNPISNKNRWSIINGLLFELNNPTMSLRDTPEWIATIEESLFGVALTCSRLDGYNIDQANTTCKEFNDGKNGEIRIAGEISKLYEFTAKNGNLMAMMTLYDTTGIIENAVIFSESLEKYRHVLDERIPIIFYGIRGKNGGFIINKCFNLK